MIFEFKNRRQATGFEIFKFLKSCIRRKKLVNQQKKCEELVEKELDLLYICKKLRQHDIQFKTIFDKSQIRIS